MKDKKPPCCEFCNYCCCCLFFFKTIDRFNKLVSDDNELLQAEDPLNNKFPTFSVHFDEYFGVFCSALDLYHTESSKAKTNENHTTTNS